MDSIMAVKPAAKKNSDLYSRLIADVVGGHIRPGERLGEESLASRWDVGRSAVREALFRLEQDGILIRKPKVGTFVRKIDEKELLEIYDIRIALEGVIVREVARAATKPELMELEKLAEQTDMLLDEDENRDHEDHAFHTRLCEISQLQHTTNLLRISHLHSQCNKYNHQLTLLRGFLRQEVFHPDHRKIVEALRSHDAERAEQMMRDHLLEAKKSCIRDIAFIRSRMQSASHSFTHPGAHTSTGKPFKNKEREHI